MEKRIICTICPLACKIHVFQDASGNIVTEGAGCERGEKFAKQELIQPKRILTTTVRVIHDGKTALLPVKTNELVSKELFNVYMRELARIIVRGDLKKGDVIYPNIGESGVDVIAGTDVNRLIF